MTPDFFCNKFSNNKKYFIVKEHSDIISIFDSIKEVKESEEAKTASPVLIKEQNDVKQ